MSMLSRMLWVAVVISGGALAAAFVFQYGFGLAPCQMCLYQRYALAAVFALGVLGLLSGEPVMAGLSGLAGLSSVGLALYHTGIERKWWAGPAACSGGGENLGALSGNDLLSTDAAPAIVRCDEIPWELFGLSMANYNIALSGLIVLACLRAFTHRSAA